MNLSYNFRNKDPIIDVLRTLVQCMAQIEGLTFNAALRRIQRETNDALKATTLYGWFAGATRYPQYRFVARLTLYLNQYARRPVRIGDRQAFPALRNVKRMTG
jgi:hypothetical protein